MKPTNPVEATLLSPNLVDRRTFFKRFARLAGIMGVAAGGITVKPSESDAFFTSGKEMDPRWKGLVSQLKQYVAHAYVECDTRAATAALQPLAAYGIQEDDVVPLQNVNRCLMPKNMFLTYSYLESSMPVPVVPVVKLFIIARQDVFDHFVVEGMNRDTLFGRRLEGYHRILLGDEIFSTADAPPVALPYDLALQKSSRPVWFIAVPYGWLHNLYGRQAPGIEERLVEELTIHEITHIELQTRDELLPFLAQFGYRMDDYWPLGSVDDLMGYLVTKHLTYHQAERLVLERIDHADAYYGSSGSAAHLGALKQIKDGLVHLTEEDPPAGLQVPLQPPPYVRPAVLCVYGPSLQRGAGATPRVEKSAGKAFGIDYPLRSHRTNLLDKKLYLVLKLSYY